MIRKRKDEEGDVNHDEIGEVNNDNDNHQRAQKICTRRLQKRYKFSVEKLDYPKGHSPAFVIVQADTQSSCHSC
jgi:hypothetical protein